MVRNGHETLKNVHEHWTVGNVDVLHDERSETFAKRHGIHDH
jgi:hypothetical protein